jgi:type I restriction enzyme M protein
MNPELIKTLWEAADKLRCNMDAAEYKHIVLGLIFLKYVSDSFDERRQEVACMVAEPTSEYYFTDDPADQKAALEDRDYYTSTNVFWVPPVACWEELRNKAKQPDIGKIIDEALVAIGHENPSLKVILGKRFARAQY